MKKGITLFFLFTGVLLIILCLLAACSIKKPDVEVYANSTTDAAINNVSDTAQRTQEPENAKITVSSPMTLSNNDMYPINGKNQHIRIRMYEGRYYEDWNPGPYMGTIWEGKFSIELIDEYGNIVTKTDLSEFFKEPLIFKFNFSLQFDDYNNDNDLDFTIGQFASSNGRDFKLFTLRKDGKIEELVIKDHPSIFISKSSGYYSLKLKKIDDTTFSKEYYNNTKRTFFEDTFKWDGEEFIVQKSQELHPQ